MSKIDEVLEILRSNVIRKNEKKSCPVIGILAFIGAIVAIAAICYGVYRYFSAQVEEELDEDFDEDFDDDFFEDEDAEQIVIPKQENQDDTEDKESAPQMTVEEN